MGRFGSHSSSFSLLLRYVCCSLTPRVASKPKEEVAKVFLACHFHLLNVESSNESTVHNY